MPQGWTDGADRYPGPVLLSTKWIECSFMITQYTAYSNPPRWSIRFKSYSQVRTSSFVCLVDIQNLRSPANSHRLFVLSETPGSASPSAGFRGNLSGVVSIVDSKKVPVVLKFGNQIVDYGLPVLSLFARIANVPDVDPGRMRHRRASSASSQGSPSNSWISLARSSSKGSIGRTSGPRVT